MANLLTKTEISDITGITSTDIPDEYVTWAETRVEKLLGKKYVETTYSPDKFFLSKDQNVLKLDHQNITSIVSFTIEDIHEDEMSEADDEYHLDKEAGLIYSSYFAPFKKIDIEYKYGGSSVEDLDKYLHLLLVIKKLSLTKPNVVNKGKISESIGDYSVEYSLADLADNPELIDEEINKVILESGTDNLIFL